MRQATISIGVPVYNGAETLAVMLDALLAQTEQNFEIIISDNASTDTTPELCRRYAERDLRIQYFRQPLNTGPGPNFKFVLDKASAPYFMWSACDDIRSPDFLEENLRFLAANPEYVASTCPDRMEGRDPVSFAILGNASQRFQTFFDHCWKSNGIFFGVIRTEVLRGCEVVGQRFLGLDWAVNLYLASRGPIHRTSEGFILLGSSGASNQRDAWRMFRTHPVGWLIPFYRVSFYTLKLSCSFTVAERASLLMRLVKLNSWSAYSQLHSQLYPFYAARVKPWLRAIKRSQT